MALPDASVVMLNGLLKSGYWRTGSEQSASRNVSNARCWFGLQWNSVSFFNKDARGLDICENLSINLR